MSSTTVMNVFFVCCLDNVNTLSPTPTAEDKNLLKILKQDKFVFARDFRKKVKMWRSCGCSYASFRAWSTNEEKT